MTGAIIVAGLLVGAVAFAMWFGRDILRQHPIRFVAVLFLAAMGAFLGYLIIWLTNILSDPAWCNKALQAERISSQNFGANGLTSCVDLLKIQLQSLADVIKMSVGSFALGMIVLVVVVLAGSRANVTLPGGIGANIGGSADDVNKAVDKVTAATVDKAAEVKHDAASATPIDQKPNPDYNGPAMPEPPAKG